MTGNITWEMLLGLFAIASFVGGVWWRVEGKIKAAEDAASQRAAAAQIKADQIAVDLAKYQLHVVETYASREGVNRQFEQVSTTIKEVGDRMDKRLDGVHERLDRFLDPSKLGGGAR
jgi:hypothetical protein